MVTVQIAAAMICFAELCYPALVGTKTPTGEFPLVYGTTEDPGYEEMSWRSTKTKK